MVELYDPVPPNKPRLAGDDTATTITILDEDFPGTLSFENTELTVNRNQEKLEITLLRNEGTDGKISCMIKTEPFIEGDEKYSGNAVEWEDYLPRHERVEFENGECEQIVQIQLVNDKNKDKEDKGKDQGDEEESDAPNELKFKIRLEKADPDSVKISKKNLCIVTILPESETNFAEEHDKMIDYFMA